MEERVVWKIWNYYWGLSIKKDNWKYYWSIENYDWDNWHEISKELYELIDKEQ